MSPNQNISQKTENYANKCNKRAENNAPRPPWLLFSWSAQVLYRKPYDYRAVRRYATGALRCMFLYKRNTLRLLPVKSQGGTAGEEKTCDKPNNRSPRDHVCNTPGLNFATSGFSAQASSAVINTSRVFAGSIIPSSHILAAPYRGSACESYVALISS